ncbi:hypothetical protein [Geomonas subterranea]|uniref:hypothetical protein n=1 Tax=Geomonas subterranea TaxID=2847989 RepID=UPI001CD694C0|nr:hypothetical protein [Geomonas fuzhouensis]
MASLESTLVVAGITNGEEEVAEPPPQELRTRVNNSHIRVLKKSFICLTHYLLKNKNGVSAESAGKSGTSMG